MDNSCDERAPLLSQAESDFHPHISHPQEDDTQNEYIVSYRVLPISLLASLGMAATIATTIYAYANLLCANPKACKDGEQSAYAAVVAIANGIAHTVAILILGPLEHLVKTQLKAGLALWIVCRAASVLCLVIGVALRSVPIAVSGRLFEGIASDNLLHFNLNTIYVSTASPSAPETYRLIAASLALYMVGTAVGPMAVTVFQNYTASFTTALAIFAVAMVYLMVFVPKPTERHLSSGPENAESIEERVSDKSRLMVLLSPLQPFYDNPLAILYGLSLLLYTAVQGHLFPVIMVFASIRFHFASLGNGLLVSVAAACAALQILLKVYIAPAIARLLGRQPATTSDNANRNTVVAAVCIQATALVAMTRVTSAVQLYLAVATSAAGLAVPAFFKSHFVSFMPSASQAISALTFMEIRGQSHPGRSILSREEPLFTPAYPANIGVESLNTCDPNITLSSLCLGDGKSATSSYLWRPRGHYAVLRISRYFAVDPELHRRKSLAAGSRHGMATWIASGPNRAAAPVTSFACSSQGCTGLEASIYTLPGADGTEPPCTLQQQQQQQKSKQAPPGRVGFDSLTVAAVVKVLFLCLVAVAWPLTTDSALVCTALSSWLRSSAPGIIRQTLDKPALFDLEKPPKDGRRLGLAVHTDASVPYNQA
ncbi:hypothetical protein H105_03839 [Trichophyton soudanense CBS 452.61]|uniref:Major facilitator superfamily (MFS) profile domain-containing protein n=1 Tax=Trichophyton soudanense CBS 452.61 TaxID=1215331 RepID=A0A022XW37_TRISD|nr:hypothetical protein H105_03839 [Trichophyton soudanense CBS 452.61]